MIDWSRFKNSRGTMAAGAAILVALGAAGGAGAVKATRPTIEMAPTIATPIARLPSTNGVVTVKGRVAEIYGDRFVIQDTSGRAMIAAGREARGTVSVGEPLTVQGRFDDGQLRASYIVDQAGDITAVGPRDPRPGGPGARPHGPGRDGPPPPPGCAPMPGGPQAPLAVPPPPPPPVNGVRPAANAAAAPPPAGASPRVPGGQTLPNAPSATPQG